MIALLLLLGALTCFYVYVKWCYGFWNRNKVPTPVPSFFVGNIGSTLIFTKHMGTILEDWYKWVQMNKKYNFPLTCDFDFDCLISIWCKYVENLIMYRISVITNYWSRASWYVIQNSLKMWWSKILHHFKRMIINLPNTVIRCLDKIHFFWTVMNGKRNEKILLRRYRRPKFVLAFLHVIFTCTLYILSLEIYSLDIYFAQIKSLYPTMQGTCDKLINYLKAVSPKEDIEAGDVRSAHKISHIIFLTIWYLILNHPMIFFSSIQFKNSSQSFIQSRMW